MEDKNGEAQLSGEKARREEAWTQLDKSFQANERVTGVIFGRVKGGFTVDLNGAVAFLPGSQVDIRPVRDITPLLGSPQPFQILKMDRSRGNIVVSRRAVLEESRAEARSELVASLKEGQILQGVVKNITDYGAFVDLGGVDGLLHVTDIAWRRINHPSEALHIGQTVKVQVIRFNSETQRISLGMKQLEAYPWECVELKYSASAPFKDCVTNSTDYGAFVWLDPGVDVENERISLRIKQLATDPHESTLQTLKQGSVVSCPVSAIADGGIEVTVGDGMPGFIRKSDLSRDRSEQRPDRFAVGEKVDAKVTAVDKTTRKVTLSIKAREVEEEKKAMAEYGSSDSGASLGDILGAALKKSAGKTVQ